MDNEKTKSKSVSLTPSLWEKVEKHSELLYGNNRSKYIRELIEADLKNNDNFDKLSSRQNETMFVDLCEMLAGYTASERAKRAFEFLQGKVSQRAFLEHILRRATFAARWLSKHPDATYDGLRFWHNKEYQENYKSSSSSTPVESISKVI